MAKVTYVDIDGQAPVVTFHGRTFEDGAVQDIPDTTANQMLLDAAAGNSHFDVTDRAQNVTDPPPSKPEPAPAPDPRQLTGAAPSGFTIDDEAPNGDPPKDPYARGSHAASQGKPKSVPPAYRGKKEGDDWTAGWEDWTKAHAEAEPPRIPSPGQAGSAE